MARRRTPRRGSNAALKTGVFLAFSLALFTGMYFLYGKLGRTWRGVQEIRVLFAQVKSLQPGAPVLYDGMELGRVRAVRIVRATPELLHGLPPLLHRDLVNLPLTPKERDRFSLIPEVEVDAAARNAINGRNMVLAVFDLLIEQDEKRLHEDDAYLVTSSKLGDCSVEILTGAGKVVPPRAGLVFLGVNADLISDIGKNMEQIAEIMQSMGDIIGGEAGRGMIKAQLANFEDFTANLETQSKAIEAKVPEVWDGIDSRAIQSEKNMTEITDNILALRPDIDAALLKTDKAIGSMRDSLGKSAGDALGYLQDYRTRARDQIQSWRKLGTEYREAVPARLKDLRKTSEGALAAADKLDAILERAEKQLRESVETSRISVDASVDAALNMQEILWQFKKSPVYFTSKYTPAQLEGRHLAWRNDTALRDYLELRRELSTVQGDMGVDDAADRERARHVEQLLSQFDAFFGVDRSAYPAYVTKPSLVNPLPATEIRSGEPVPVPPPVKSGEEPGTTVVPRDFDPNSKNAVPPNPSSIPQSRQNPAQTQGKE